MLLIFWLYPVLRTSAPPADTESFFPISGAGVEIDAHIAAVAPANRDSSFGITIVHIGVLLSSRGYLLFY
tara:strand:+ start:500 stop:709 length:210 start_codon:yes stop_codon:yes gene_type:complete